MADSKNKLTFYKDKLGQRQYSLASLREKIEDQFLAESAGRADILNELDTRPKRLAEISQVADYVLSTEYVNLPAEAKQQIIEDAVANLFYFGVLDAYVRNPAVTEITIEGPFEVSVRHEFGDLEKIESPFITLPHLERTLAALVGGVGAVISTESPYLEVGLTLHGRSARLSLIGPPVSPMYSIQLRLHPAITPTLSEFATKGIAETLQTILAGGHGLLVTGEAGSGKTTCIAALLNAYPHPDTGIVERAHEMSLSGEVRRYTPQPPTPNNPTQDFGATIQAAGLPSRLVLDEIRGDESAAFWDVLTDTGPSQLIIAFRGTNNPARLHSALGIVVRKHQFSLESERINAALLAKLPYVAVVHRAKDHSPSIASLGRWVANGTGLSLEMVI